MTKKNYTNILRFLVIALLTALTLTACSAKETIFSPTEQAVEMVEPTAIATLVPTSSIPSGLYPSYMPLITKPDILSTNQLVFTYGFSVFILDKNKNGFQKLNPKGFGELRSISWSPDGKSLAMVGIGGTTAIESNIYVVDSNGNDFHPLVPEPMPYLMDVTWSHDGERLVTWTLDDNTVLYLVNNDGTGLTKVELGMQIFGRPQFAPDDASLYFVGADKSSGLFQVRLDGSHIRQVSSLVDNPDSVAWSRDGSRLAYIETDTSKKETRLVVENTDGSIKTIVSTLPFSELNSSGHTLTLGWTPDGNHLLFNIEISFDYAIYLANADASGTRKLIKSARMPSISPDGKWVAYISTKNKLPQLLLVDLTAAMDPQVEAAPIALADLPTTRSGLKAFDKIQWKP